MKIQHLLRICCLIIFMSQWGAAMAIEEPQFDVLSQETPYEVRHYRPMLIAQVTVEGDMDEASNKGFRQIAGFIFGSNQPLAESDMKSMVSASSSSGAPLSTAESKGVKIAMTAPVTIKPQAADQGINAKLWRVNFVMPSQYTLKTIPRPQNPAVELQEVPEKFYAVMSFTGFNFQSKVQQHMDDTVKWALSKGYTVLGPAQLSRYDPPWTLPMFRRNEIMLEIAKP